MKKLRIKNIDIREILDNENIHYSEHGKNVSKGWIGVQCPFCDDSSNHLGINLSHLTISCFSCGTTGTVLKYLSNELGSFTKAKKILKKAIPRELKKEISFEQNIITECKLPEGASKSIPKEHKKYFKKRGFDLKKLSKKYSLYFTKEVYSDWKWSWRVIIPVYRNRKLVTFTSISIKNEVQVRYLHCPDENSIIPIKHILLGEEFTNKSKIIVVEGIFDFFRLGDGCVSVLGTKTTIEQAYLLSKYQRVILLFDGDKAGKAGADRLSSYLSALTKVILFELPEGIDPDKLGKNDIAYLRNY